MTPSKEPFADNIENLGIPKQDISNLSLDEEQLFFKDKQGNILPYYKEDLYGYFVMSGCDEYEYYYFENETEID